MSTSVRFARSATLAVGVISLLAAAPAGAQRHGLPRIGVAAPPPQTPVSRPGFPMGTNGVVDPRVS